MAISKNDVVVFTHPKSGEVDVGFVESKTAKSMKLVYQKDGRLYFYKTDSRITPQMLTEGLNMVLADKTTTIPKQISELVAEKTAAPAKKNDIVKFVHEGKECTGRVLKGGQNAEVTLDELHTLRLPSADLSPASMPAADKGLEDWSIISYKVVHGHDDSEPFQAVIGYKGKPVILASNDGWGGCNLYSPKTPAAKADLERFEGAIADFSKRIGSTYPENTDLWIHWEWYIRPTGMSFEQYLTSMPTTLR
jgi:hypothetical protein